jgi:predicted PurR-regulated permease PerM
MPLYFTVAARPTCMQSPLALTRSTRSTLIGVAIVTALCSLVWLLGPVLTPFLIAAVIAYALAPMVGWLVRRSKGKLPRTLAVVLVELLFLIALAGVALLIVPILAKELPLLKDQVPLVFEKLARVLDPLLAQWGFKVNLDVGAIKAFVLKYLGTNFDDAFGQVLASLKIGGSVAMTVISNAILVPVALFYFLMDWDALVSKTLRWVPAPLRPAVDSFTHEADEVLGQYLRGQLLVMLVLAVFYSVGLALFGLDLALPIGVFTGLAVFVPYLGFGLGLVLALLAGFLQFASSWALVMVAVVYGLGQVIESIFLTPKLVGERIGLHPLAVIFALLAFGQVLGFVGILIALPASAVLLVGLRRLQTLYLSSKFYAG